MRYGSLPGVRCDALIILSSHGSLGPSRALFFRLIFFMPLGLPQDQSTLDSTPVGTNISDAGARAITEAVRSGGGIERVRLSDFSSK